MTRPLVILGSLLVVAIYAWATIDDEPEPVRGDTVCMPVGERGAEVCFVVGQGKRVPDYRMVVGPAVIHEVVR